MSYSVQSSSDLCYPDTTVLINKLNVRDQKQLDENEALIASVKSVQFELSPFSGKPDYNYYKRLHHYVFGEIYEWAGVLRTVNIGKLHTTFCPVAQLDDFGKRIFAVLEQKDFLMTLSRNEYISELTELYCSINYWHPFREGNGRVQRLFFRYLATQAGYRLNFSDVDSDIMMVATIHAASGMIHDLHDIFERIIQ